MGNGLAFAAGDRFPVKPPEEVQGAGGAKPGRYALPQFSLTAADGQPLSPDAFKGEFVVVAFQDKGQAKKRLDKLADILFNIGTLLFSFLFL